MTWDGLSVAGFRIRPTRMGVTLALQVAPMESKMPQQGIALNHCSELIVYTKLFTGCIASFY